MEVSGRNCKVLDVQESRWKQIEADGNWRDQMEVHRR